MYEDGTKYIGDWNDRGQKHGLGHVQLKDNTRYEGGFSNGLFSGLGILQYPDGARYTYCPLIIIVYDLAMNDIINTQF